jgi:shikimate dehydrogenase
MTDQYAVFGHPIGHSKSPKIHALFAQQTGQDLVYIAQDVPAETFPQALGAFRDAGGQGLNCTVPLKTLAYSAAHELSDRAQCAGAVNTLALKPDGGWFGENTDGMGLTRDLEENLGLTLRGSRILILGAGGAVRGILHPLLGRTPTRLTIANRNQEKAGELARLFAPMGEIETLAYDQLSASTYDLILNATAASLDQQLPPLPDGILAEQAVCYDLAYANQPTPFVRWGREQGAKLSVDGIGMLVEQAAEAFLLWRGVRPMSGPVLERLNGERG